MKALLLDIFLHIANKIKLDYDIPDNGLITLQVVLPIVTDSRNKIGGNAVLLLKPSTSYSFATHRTMATILHNRCGTEIYG